MGWRELAGKVKRRVTLSHLVPWMRGEFLRQQRRLDQLERQLLRVQEALGRIESRQTSPGSHDAGGLAAFEFRVHSQWGEDGIIDHLVRAVPIARPFFVEFGVESYVEANTRFLLTQRHWSGLVMDGDAAQVEQITRRPGVWLHDLRAVQAFVTRENINRLLSEHDAAGAIGLLSIDIDGMDWWIWDAIEVSRPAIVVVEYNHRFGPEQAVTVPYAADFDRRRAHHSLCYYGASLAALERLGRRKGYGLVGCGSAGLNAFFVDEAVRPASLPPRTSVEAWIEGRFNEYHDESGCRVRRSAVEQRSMLEGLPLVSVDESGRAVP
jgi:hypothetical protein